MKKTILTAAMIMALGIAGEKLDKLGDFYKANIK